MFEWNRCLHFDAQKTLYLHEVIDFRSIVADRGSECQHYLTSGGLERIYYLLYSYGGGKIVGCSHRGNETCGVSVDFQMPFAIDCSSDNQIALHKER